MVKQVWVDRKKALKSYLNDVKLGFLMAGFGCLVNFLSPTRHVIGIYIGLIFSVLSFFTLFSYLKKEVKNEFKGDS